MNIEEKMRLTIELAKEALNSREIPIAAIVYLENEIVSKSFVTEKTDKRYLVHAEIKALMEADSKRFSMKERKNAAIYYTRALYDVFRRSNAILYW